VTRSKLSGEWIRLRRRESIVLVDLRWNVLVDAMVDRV